MASAFDNLRDVGAHSSVAGVPPGFHSSGGTSGNEGAGEIQAAPGGTLDGSWSSSAAARQPALESQAACDPMPRTGHASGTDDGAAAPQTGTSAPQQNSRVGVTSAPRGGSKANDVSPVPSPHASSINMSPASQRYQTRSARALSSSPARRHGFVDDGRAPLPPGKSDGSRNSSARRLSLPTLSGSSRRRKVSFSRLHRGSISPLDANPAGATPPPQAAAAAASASTSSVSTSMEVKIRARSHSVTDARRRSSRTRDFARDVHGNIKDGMADATLDVLEVGGLPTTSEQVMALPQKPVPGRRRESTMQVSKASTDAAKRLANRWGGKASIKKTVRTVKRPYCILSPGSKLMRRWDTLTLLCLILVALVTPYELAFLNPGPGDTVFIMNRVIDSVFIFDILFTFFLEYRDEDTMLWIYDYKMIAARYLRSWFFIDFVSVLPFDLMSLFLEAGNVKNLQLIRVLRVAKLAKLARVMRLARIHARWERDMDIPFATLALLKFGLYMLTMTHWFACLWGFLGSIQTDTAFEEMGSVMDDTSWVQYFGYHDRDSTDKYIISVHWAMQTVSTIGYGDIRPVTTLERLVACLCMAYGASVWTYVVASVCGIVTSLDPHGTHRKHTIAEVNEFMQTKQLAKRWRPRLRSFFISRENFHRTLASRRLLRLMSPQLRGEVARHLNQAWIHRVPYLRHISDQFVTELAMSLEQEFFAPEEFIRSDCLHILEKGVCLQDSRIIPNGFVWGEDMILKNPLLRNTKTATFFHSLSFFPEDRKFIIAAANWITVRRKLLMWMSSIRAAGEDVESGLLSRISMNLAARLAAKREPLRLLKAATSGGQLNLQSLLSMSAANQQTQGDTGVAKELPLS